jgi:hypothetical protein
MGPFPKISTSPLHPDKIARKSSAAGTALPTTSAALELRRAKILENTRLRCLRWRRRGARRECHSRPRGLPWCAHARALLRCNDLLYERTTILKRGLSLDFLAHLM